MTHVKFAHWLLFFPLSLSCHPALAQSNAKPANSTPIRYLRNIPKSVLKIMPRGAKSLFWGTFSAKKGSAMMAVHLFDPNWKKNFQISQRGGEPNLIYADLFKRSGSTWSRVRHLAVRYNGFFTRRMRLDVSFLWLDQAQTLPIIRFNSLSFSVYGGSEMENVSDEVLLVFPSGFGGPLRIEEWDVGFWRASDTLGRDVSYGPFDKRGFLQFKTEESLNDDVFVRRWKTYRWNGKKFVVTKTFTKRGI